jgi:hypothetical protein
MTVVDSVSAEQALAAAVPMSDAARDLLELYLWRRAAQLKPDLAPVGWTDGGHLIAWQWALPGSRRSCSEVAVRGPVFDAVARSIAVLMMTCQPFRLGPPAWFRLPHANGRVGVGLIVEALTE